MVHSDVFLSNITCRAFNSCVLELEKAAASLCIFIYYLVFEV